MILLMEYEVYKCIVFNVLNTSKTQHKNRRCVVFTLVHLRKPACIRAFRYVFCRKYNACVCAFEEVCVCDSLIAVISKLLQFVVTKLYCSFLL